MKNNVLFFIISIVFGFLIWFVNHHFNYSGSLFLAPLSPLFKPVTLLFFWGLILSFLPCNIFLMIAGTILGQFISWIPEIMHPPSSSVGGAFYVLGNIFLLGTSFIILTGNRVGRILNKLAIRKLEKTENKALLRRP
uniref:Uncharacterized protein n=1 Tax=Candidatus Berkiella aquae TaxID=295108 RepID=A0A0Q9Z083_9GAMM